VGIVPGFRDKRLADALARLPSGPQTDPLIDTDGTAGFDDSWRWPAALEDFIIDHMNDDSTVVNAPAGQSTLGDVLIDADPQHEDVYMDDIGEMALPNSCADLVLSDPPWKVQSTDLRERWFKEAVRIAKSEGRIIYNAGWIPDHDRVTHLDTRTRVDDDVGSATYLTLYRKDPPPGPVAAEELQKAYRGVASLNQLMAFGDDPEPPHHRKVVYNNLVTPILGGNCSRFDADDVDPRIMDPKYHRFNCPACSNRRLEPMSVESFADILYECRHCGFRARHDEVDERNRTDQRPDHESALGDANGKLS
jgi:Zn ribbon nucleic-acid-binding protein